MRHVYIVVRADLPCSHQAVQAAHAGISATRSGFIEPDEPHPSLVVCTVPDEPSLIHLTDTLRSRGIRHERFVEDDMGKQVTALATEPLDKSRRKMFKELPLL